jgi:lipopolysaccharide/colanic/teichoic acid biosynthesis glycosyltransferase
MRAGDRLYQEVVADYARRHRIKPGLTGWAQISGLRCEIDCVDKARRRVEHDIYYIEHWSLLFDLRIMLRTLLVVLDSRGVY